MAAKLTVAGGETMKVLGTAGAQVLAVYPSDPGWEVRGPIGGAFLVTNLGLATFPFRGIVVHTWGRLICR